MICHEPVDVHALTRRNVGDDEVLVRRETEIALVNGRDLLEAGQEHGARVIRYAAGLDAQREMPATIVSAQPAEAIALRRELEGARRLELKTQALVELRLEPVDSA